MFTIDASGEAVLLLFGFQGEGGLCLDPAAPQADRRPGETTDGYPVLSLLDPLTEARERRIEATASRIAVPDRIPCATDIHALTPGDR